MKLGTNLEDNSDFEIDLKTLLNTHTFIQGQTGSGKTSLILKIVEQVRKERPDVQMVFLDDQEEFTDIPSQMDGFKLISRNATPKTFTLDHAKDWGIQTRKLGLSVVINLHDFEDQHDRETFVGEFLKGFKSLGKKVGHPSMVFIDEADQYVPTRSNKSNIPSRYPIVDLTKRAKKFNISMILCTQYGSEVDIRARRETANRIVGKTTELRARRAVSELLGDPKVADELFDLEVGTFFVRGSMFKKGVSKIYVEESNITRKLAGVEQEEVKKSDYDVIEEAVEHNTEQNLVEILDEKIANLEKQLADQKVKTTQAYNEGFFKADQQFRNKGKIERLLK